MKKVCVFCGEKPTDKSLEHVIPSWLLKITGDPKRSAQFAPVWNEKKAKFDVLSIPFDQFRFPACKECNERYSALENRAKVIIDSIMSGHALSSADLALLLSWLDKVRIGLWLGYYYLQRNIAGIEPHMFIDSRSNTSDRLVFIYRTLQAQSGVRFMGVNMPAFQYAPCCFTLQINHIFLFNASTDFLFSRRLGLPFPRAISWASWPYVSFDMSPGRERVMLPLIRKNLDTRCSQIYQPMFRSQFRLSHPDMYARNYVRDLMEDPLLGIGNILYVAPNNHLCEYPSTPSREWIPPENVKLWSERGLIARQTFEFQLLLMRLGPKPDSLDPKQRDAAEKQYKMSQDMADMIIKKL